MCFFFFRRLRAAARLRFRRVAGNIVIRRIVEARRRGRAPLPGIICIIIVAELRRKTAVNIIRRIRRAADITPVYPDFTPVLRPVIIPERTLKLPLDLTRMRRDNYQRIHRIPARQKIQTPVTLTFVKVKRQQQQQQKYRQRDIESFAH